MILRESFVKNTANAIEDHFVSGRPEWNLIGAELVEDVRPFEENEITHA